MKDQQFSEEAQQIYQFYEQVTKKAAQTNYNIFLSDEESSFLSLASNTPKDKKQKLKQLLHLPNITYQEGFNYRVAYLPYLYFLATSWAVMLGVSNFWEQEDRIFYFYDKLFLNSQYFNFILIVMSILGIMIQYLLYAGNNLLQNKYFIVAMFENGKLRKQQFDHLVLAIGVLFFFEGHHQYQIVSHLFLIAYAILPTDNQFNKHKLTPLLKFEDAIFLNIHLIFMMLFNSYVYVHNKHPTKVRSMIYATLCLIFFCFILLNARNEFLQTKIFNSTQESVQLLIPYMIILIEGLFTVTLASELSQITIQWQKKREQFDL